MFIESIESSLFLIQVANRLFFSRVGGRENFFHCKKCGMHQYLLFIYVGFDQLISIFVPWYVVLSTIPTYGIRTLQYVTSESRVLVHL